MKRLPSSTLLQEAVKKARTTDGCVLLRYNEEDGVFEQLATDEKPRRTLFRFWVCAQFPLPIDMTNELRNWLLEPRYIADARREHCDIYVTTFRHLTESGKFPRHFQLVYSWLAFQLEKDHGGDEWFCYTRGNSTNKKALSEAEKNWTVAEFLDAQQIIRFRL